MQYSKLEDRQKCNSRITFLLPQFCWTKLIISNHQTLLDSEGHKIGVLIPYTEYEELMQLFSKYSEYIEMESGLKRAFKEVRQIKSGKKPRKSLSSFLDEL